MFQIYSFAMPASLETLKFNGPWICDDKHDLVYCIPVTCKQTELVRISGFLLKTLNNEWNTGKPVSQSQEDDDTYLRGKLSARVRKTMTLVSGGNCQPESGKR